MTRPCPRTCIQCRIDVALTRFESEGWDVRAIYLDQTDRDALDAARTKEFGMKCHVCGYRGHPIKLGKRSMVYSTHGCIKSVPKRLSHRTA